jgi:hypothetical protein
MMLLRFAKGVGQFWYDFIIGDDWKIAAAVVTVLAGAIAAVAAGVGATVLIPFFAAAIVVGFVAVMFIDVAKS